jgi:hypothetical protein
VWERGYPFYPIFCMHHVHDSLPPSLAHGTLNAWKASHVLHFKPLSKPLQPLITADSSITNPLIINPPTCLPYARNAHHNLHPSSAISTNVLASLRPLPSLAPSPISSHHRPPFTENGPLYILPPRLQPTSHSRRLILSLLRHSSWGVQGVVFTAGINLLRDG